MRKGWTETTLGEVAGTVKPSPAPIDPVPYVGLEHFDSGSPRISRWASTADVASMTTAFNSGDVLFSKLRPYLRKVAVPHFAGRCTAEALVYTPTVAALERSYLALVLQSIAAIAHADASSAGSRMPRTSVGLMSNLGVPLPPLPEQRRIVDLIGALDDAMASGARVAAEAAGLAVAMRRALPEGDEVELGSMLTGIESGVSTKPIDGPGQRVRLLSLAAIRPARFYPTEIKDIGAAVLPERARLRERDLLITRSNTPDRVGYVCMAREVPEDTFLPDLVWRLVPDERRVTKEYLEQVLSSPQLRTAITASATGTSQSMRKINKAGFARLRIPVPARPLQDAYTDPLQELGAVQRRQSEAIDELRELRGSLLTALLSGEHEIPESYDELMEVAS